jgi:hypothetical protein
MPVQFLEPPIELTDGAGGDVGFCKRGLDCHSSDDIKPSRANLSNGDPEKNGGLAYFISFACNSLTASFARRNLHTF